MAIETILNQTYRDFEFLIINDCSSDESRDVILGYDDLRIRLIDNDVNIGQTRSLNEGLKHTRTELVARIDADDVSHPTRLEKQFRFLEAHPEVAIVGINMHRIDARGRVIGKLARPPLDHQIRWMQFFETPISGGAAMYRKSVVWDELGGYDASIRYSQDWELLWRVPRRYKLASIPEFLLDARSHAAAANSAMLEKVHLEIRSIYHANMPLVLGADVESLVWQQQIDMLSEGVVQRRIRHPGLLFRLIQTLFERFCKIYPAAVDDPVVLDTLSTQFFRVVEWSRLRKSSDALRVLRSAWKITPPRRFFRNLLRIAVGLAGGRAIRDWFQAARL